MKKLKRIAFSIPNFDTCGAGEVLLNVVLNLPRDLYHPIIICKHDRGFLFEQIRIHKIEYHLFNSTTVLRPISNLIKGVWLISRKLKRLELDMLYSYHYLNDYSEPLACKLIGVPFLYLKNNMSWQGPSYNGWRLRSWLSKEIVCINREMVQEFFPGHNNVSLIYHGVNFTKYHSSVNYNLRQNKIVMVANLVEVKGAETLLNAFLKAKLDNWTCTIVGDNTTDYGINLTALYAKYSNIVFTGKVSNVNDYLSESKIFVLPTLNSGRKEGFPGATLEAMSNGMVVLGSNICGIRDQMEEQFSEFLFTAGDVDDLSEKLKLITKYSDYEMDQVGRNMRSYVLDNFSIKREVDELVNLFNKIM